MTAAVDDRPTDPGTWRYGYDPEPRQLVFHQSQSDEILYGGAGGGGKTDALLAECVTLCLAVPNVKVILFRRTFGELEAEIIPRLQERIPAAIASYNVSKHEFRFHHNNARFRLGFIDRDADKYKYQGAEYQLIAWDELTQQLRSVYDYLNTRCRAAGQVARDLERLGTKPRVIATTNPGGRGHGWVKAMFVDPCAVRDQEFTVDLPDGQHVTRTYIPAKATDNRHLNLTQYMRQLAGVDEMLRRAIRDGDWDVLEGTRFASFRKAIHTIPPERAPIPLVGYPRAVGVDYGMKNPFAALWGAKLQDDLVVIYRELYRTELTPRQQAELIRDSEQVGERDRTRPIPIALDPACWQRDANVLTHSIAGAAPSGSIAWHYQQVFGSQVVRARNDRKAGWSLVDQALLVQSDGWPRLLIYQTCPNLIRLLPEQMRDDKDPEDVDTHGEDHLCFPATVFVTTDHGSVGIADVRAGMRVATRAGWRTVQAAGLTARAAEVGVVVLSNGTRLEATPNHPVWANGGWVRLDALRYGDKVEVWHSDAPKSSSTTASATTDTPTRMSGRSGFTSWLGSVTAKLGTILSTAKSGATRTARSLTAGMFTTSTTTHSTTTSATSNASLPTTTRCTTATTRSVSQQPASPSKLLARSLLRGMAVRLAGRGTESTARQRGSAAPQRSTSARTAVLRWSPARAAMFASAPTTARRLLVESQAWTTKPASARSAGSSSPATGTRQPSPVPVHVVESYVTTRHADVYNLTVQGAHEFYADGVLVHNCDALRYLLMQLLRGGSDRTTRQPDPLAARAVPVTADLRSTRF